MAINTTAIKKVLGLPAWLASHWQNWANFMTSSPLRSIGFDRSGALKSFFTFTPGIGLTTKRSGTTWRPGTSKKYSKSSQGFCAHDLHRLVRHAGRSLAAARTLILLFALDPCDLIRSVPCPGYRAGYIGAGFSSTGLEQVERVDGAPHRGRGVVLAVLQWLEIAPALAQPPLVQRLFSSGAGDVDLHRWGNAGAALRPQLGVGSLAIDRGDTRTH
ncbi:hypothetical protein D3C76_872280 [compost metagenome]